MIWSQGIAGRSVFGERTQNPTMAEKYLLEKHQGKRRARALIKQAKKRRRSSYKGNPPLALLGSLGSLGKLFGFGGPDPEKQKQRVAHIEGLRDVVAGTMKPWAGMTQRLALTNLQGIAQGRERMGVAINDVTVQAAQAALAQLGKDPSGAVTPAGPAAPTGVQQLTQFLGSPAGGQLVRIGAQAARPRRGRQRYPTYTDRYGRQRYSTRPPGGAPMRLPAGAVMSAGTPYNFFTGAVGKGGVGATAGQLAIAGAAGVGAYLATQAILKRLGGRAQSQEEAGVSVAMATGDAIREYTKQHGGTPPSPAVRAEMKAAMQAKLVELGYDPVTFTRTRSGLEGFLETYNPFGG